MIISKQINRKLAVIIVAITVIVGMFFANPARFNKASAAENEYSFVLDDLKRDSSFYVSNYSKTSKGSSWYSTCSVKSAFLPNRRTVRNNYNLCCIYKWNIFCL